MERMLRLKNSFVQSAALSAEPDQTKATFALLPTRRSTQSGCAFEVPPKSACCER